MTQGPSRPFLALQCALGLLIFAVPLIHSSLALYHLKWAVIGLLTPLITYLWLRRGSPLSPLPRLFSPIVLLLLASLLSLLQAINLYYGLQQLAFALHLLLLYLAAAKVAASAQARLWLVHCLTLALLAVSGASLYFYLAGPFPGSTEVLVRLFGNTNYGAAYLLTVIPLSLAQLLKAPSGWEKIVGGLTAFLSVVCLLLSRVRGAWVGMFVGLAVLLWVLYRAERGRGDFRPFLVRHLRPVVYLMGGAVVLASLLFPLEGLEFLARVASIFDPQTVGLQTRLAMWKGTLEMIGDHLWTGVGVGNFTFAYVPYRSAVHYDRPAMRIEHPHNEYLGIWSELGILGLLPLLWLIVRVFRLGWRLVERSEVERGVLAGVLGGLASSACYANFFYVFHMPASAMNVAILLGVLEGMGEEEARGDHRLPLGRPIVLTVVCVIALFALQYSLRPLLGDLYTQLAEREVAAGKIEGGLASLERALAWHPQHFVARYRRAVLYLQTGRFPEAIREAEAVLTVHPNLQLAYGIIGTAYAGLGDTTKAKRLYEQALAINPHDPHALNNLGVILLEEGRVAEAEALFQRAITVSPQEDDTYANLGVLYRRVGRYFEAVVVYRQAAARNEKWSGHVWYAVTLHHLDSRDSDTAYGALARAIYLDERWRGRAVKEPLFEEWRRKEARLRILLNLE